MALRHLNVLEFSGIGPGPFLGTMLADFGANVIAVERPNSFPPTTNRGKKVISGVDLKDRETVEMIKQLASKVCRFVVICLHKRWMFSLILTDQE